MGRQKLKAAALCSRPPVSSLCFLSFKPHSTPEGLTWCPSPCRWSSWGREEPINTGKWILCQWTGILPLPFSVHFRGWKSERRGDQAVLSAPEKAGFSYGLSVTIERRSMWSLLANCSDPLRCSIFIYSNENQWLQLKWHWINTFLLFSLWLCLLNVNHI